LPLSKQETVLKDYGPVQEDRRLLLCATISVKPPGVTERMFKPQPEQDPLLTFAWPWGEMERPETFEVWPNSVLSELHKTSVRLAKEHPWSVEDASLFILTGEVIRVSPLAYSTNRTDRHSRSQVRTS
jgi:hypothetical protein